MRWHAVITYRTEAGPLSVEHDFEELEGLHDIVERGPSWDCIADIIVTLAQPSYPNLTLEAAEKL